MIYDKIIVTLGINVFVMMSADDSLRRGAYLCEDICNHNDGNIV